MELGKVPSLTEKGKDQKKPKAEKGDRFGRDRKEIFSFLCMTWNFAKFHAFLSMFLYPHSVCPLNRSDEATWQNVIFSIKTLKIKE